MRAAFLFPILLVFIPSLSLSSGSTSHRQHPPVTALAYSSDSKLLAAGMRSEVHLLESDSGDELQILPGQGPKVTALAFRKDNQFLAVASGTAGKNGEVRLYAVNQWDKPPLTISA